ncbi:Arc family DNA-binding protein [Endozoicomonas sp. ONNA2]|uniref:Arc family DNA-binding protein n=1 Tax=Endozoicomonas sp. ONNA2 TaxID=2828741 RepID=UPI0021488E68|nr:Arc family DNA-binding protein [Endozoicomonas sp. ONNA2]
MEETAEPSQFSLRLPPDVRQYLHTCANKHGRSLNSEILKRLEYSIDLESRHESNLVKSITEISEDFSGGSDVNNAMVLKELMTIRETLEYLSSDKHSTDMIKIILRFLARKI